MVSTMLCTKVRAKTTPSWPAILVTETPVAMFCGEIILPITPPDELVAANRMGLRSSCRAATTCRFPNSALPDVSLPDNITATQPRKGESRTKSARSKQPLAQRIGKAGVVHQVGKANDQHHRDNRQPGLTDGSPTQLRNAAGENLTRNAVMIAATRIAVPMPAAESPDRAIGLVVVQRDRNRMVQARPGDVLLPDRGHLERGPQDHDDG